MTVKGAGDRPVAGVRNQVRVTVASATVAGELRLLMREAAETSDQPSGYVNRAFE